MASSLEILNPQPCPVDRDASARQTDPSLQVITRLCQKALEGMNSRNWEGCYEAYAANIVVTAYSPSVQTILGVQAFVAYLRGLTEMCPSIHLEVLSITVERQVGCLPGAEKAVAWLIFKTHAYLVPTQMSVVQSFWRKTANKGWKNTRQVIITTGLMGFD